MSNLRTRIVYLFLLTFACMIVSCTSNKEGISEKKELSIAELEIDSIGNFPITGDTMHIEYKSYTDLLELMTDLDYTPESWRSGSRTVPRAFVMNIPDRWRNEVTREIDVPLKKRLFFRALAPLALYSNEAIRKERTAANTVRNKSMDSWSASEKSAIVTLARKYKLLGEDDTEISSETVERLWIHVDEIPVSLVLAQSAEESGWGTSRFAAEGNALFGQWAWGDNAIKPEQQREGMGNYGIARFDSPLESMQAYMLNLNTHSAYADLRKKRAEIRANGGMPTGRTLAATLTKYSERGEAYVTSIHGIMDVNHLDPADSTTLLDTPVILLYPVD